MEPRSLPSKMQMVREAIAQLGRKAKPIPIQQFIKDKYGVDLPTTQISSYKTHLKKNPGRTSLDGTDDEEDSSDSNPGRSDLLLEFVSTVREFEEKLGQKRVLEAIRALYKKTLS